MRGVATLGETERKRLEAVCAVFARFAGMRSPLFLVALCTDAPMFRLAALPIAPNVRMRIASRKSECARNRQSDAKRRDRKVANRSFHVQFPPFQCTKNIAHFRCEFNKRFLLSVCFLCSCPIQTNFTCALAVAGNFGGNPKPPDRPAPSEKAPQKERFSCLLLSECFMPAVRVLPSPSR